MKKSEVQSIINGNGYSKKVVLAAISAIVSFTAAETILLFIKGSGYPDFFVRCWFTFWSVELSALAGIKIVKTRTNPYTQSSSSSSSTDSDEEIGG